MPLEPMPKPKFPPPAPKTKKPPVRKPKPRESLSLKKPVDSGRGENIQGLLPPVPSTLNDIFDALDVRPASVGGAEPPVTRKVIPPNIPKPKNGMTFKEFETAMVVDDLDRISKPPPMRGG